MKTVLVLFIILLSASQGSAFIKLDVQYGPPSKTQIHEVIYEGGEVESESLLERMTYRLQAHVDGKPFESRTHCTSVLIDKDILLTAAHCILEGSEHSVFFYNNQNIAAEAIKVTHIIKHKEYGKDPAGKLPLINDLALLKIEKPIPNGLIPILPEASYRMQPEEKMLVVGYGRNQIESSRLRTSLKYDPKFRALDEELQKKRYVFTANNTVDEDKLAYVNWLFTQLPLLGTTASLNPDEGFIFNGRVFSGLTVNSVCKGDSGGPTFLKGDNGKLTLVGIHSLGNNEDCSLINGAKKLYDVYVPAYVPWIREVIKEIQGSEI